MKDIVGKEGDMVFEDETSFRRILARQPLSAICGL